MQMHIFLPILGFVFVGGIFYFIWRGYQKSRASSQKGS